MAKVELIEYTGKGREDEVRHAANVLAFTKATRLNMDGDLFESIQNLSEEEINKELAYMAGTIPSSWEFVDVTFLISRVSRACAQQITRTRTASYAMQSQRVTDLSEVHVLNPFDETEQPDLFRLFDEAQRESKTTYRSMSYKGGKAQDMRGILPINTECNLVAKYNLRSFVDLIQARSSLRVQGEYSDIADQMKEQVLAVWPWAAPFFVPKMSAAIAMLESVVDQMGLETGKGAGWEIAKAIDLMRKA